MESIVWRRWREVQIGTTLTNPAEIGKIGGEWQTLSVDTCEPIVRMDLEVLIKNIALFVKQSTEDKCNAARGSSVTMLVKEQATNNMLLVPGPVLLSLCIRKSSRAFVTDT